MGTGITSQFLLHGRGLTFPSRAWRLSSFAWISTALRSIRFISVVLDCCLFFLGAPVVPGLQALSGGRPTRHSSPFCSLTLWFVWGLIWI